MQHRDLLVRPSESKEEGLDPLPGEEEQPAVGVAERRLLLLLLPDIQVGKLADEAGLAPEGGADGAGGRAAWPTEGEVGDGLPAAARHVGERRSADGLADGETGDDVGEHLRREGVQGRRRRRSRIALRRPQLAARRRRHYHPDYSIEQYGIPVRQNPS
jgi:hypothetical protein|uniref:Uncharacterized protein n=1 Tax=Oryza sativa subsp. japonica TaxID=39947 RepID=Q6Z223_ORYSJ|nr:hypothetical protein [Oryza sativa Japonica Group]BAD10295.1 hypothetical protein [Oryza sativa Japonica Group]